MATPIPPRVPGRKQDFGACPERFRAAQQVPLRQGSPGHAGADHLRDVALGAPDRWLPLKPFGDKWVNHHFPATGGGGRKLGYVLFGDFPEATTGEENWVDSLNHLKRAWASLC